LPALTAPLDRIFVDRLRSPTSFPRSFRA
jgi:hypothetical protein